MSQGKPETIDAEFEPAAGARGTTAEIEGEGKGLAVSARVPERIAALAQVLEAHQVPEGVRSELIAIAGLALETARRQVDLEKRVGEMALANDTRSRALAALLLGGDLSVVTGSGVEKAPEKLSALKIDIPGEIELVKDSFVMTVENPNGEEVSAEIRIAFQSYDGKEEPVIEAVVNPSANRGGILVSRPITLGPKEKQQVEVALRSKFAKEVTPKTTDIIAEQAKVTIKLIPTNIDSALPERAFPPLLRDVKLTEVLVYQAEASATAYADTGVMYERLLAPYDLSIPGIEWRIGYGADQEKQPWTTAVSTYTDVKREQLGEKFTATFTTRSYRARTIKGKIPVTVSPQITVQVAPTLGRPPKN